MIGIWSGGQVNSWTCLVPDTCSDPNTWNSKHSNILVDKGLRRGSYLSQLFLFPLRKPWQGGMGGRRKTGSFLGVGKQFWVPQFMVTIGYQQLCCVTLLSARTVKHFALYIVYCEIRCLVFILAWYLMLCRSRIKKAILWNCEGIFIISVFFLW